MKFVKPSRVAGALAAPSSKSMMQRAVALAVLTAGESEIRRPSFADDSVAALDAAVALGARVTVERDRVRIAGDGWPRGAALDCGESGLALRMFAAVAALQSTPATLTGRGSLLRRPVGFIETTLRAFGAEASTADGKPPLRVCGPLRAREAPVDGSISSQFLSGLLIALPRRETDSTLTVANLQSKPYVRLTLEMLRRAGAAVQGDDAMTRFEIAGGQRYRPQSWEIEGDWSGAAFLLVAGAIAGRVVVRGLDPRSAQADRAILDALQLAGAQCTIDGDAVAVEHSTLRGFDFDATDCPDLFPPLVALAASCAGTSALAGVGRLRHKESDRAAALAGEFARLGGRLRFAGDKLLIDGGPLAGGAAQAHNDHRMAMALAVAALVSRDGVTIDDEACVAKSYPEFFADLASLTEVPS
jgi:3-phosphoshikimate 1-carboxyvinyltransferase